MVEVRPGWLIAAYTPTAFFSLRGTLSTSTGGATLFVPTPYAIKLALVDAAYRMHGDDLARKVFKWVRDCEVRIKPPRSLVVNHTFTKIRQTARPSKETVEQEDSDKIDELNEDSENPKTPYTANIGYREYCAYQGTMEIALQRGDWAEEDERLIGKLFAHINYLGKRGSFLQYLGWQVQLDLPGGFSILPEEWDRLNPNLYGVLQYLDDVGKGTWTDLFERINSYADKNLKLKEHRVLRQYLLPYKRRKSAKSFTYYSSG